MMDGLHPSLSPDRRETAQERAQAIYEAARVASDPIEYFGNWLGTIWDFDPDAVCDHDLYVMAEITDWMAAMPVSLKGAFLAYVKQERRKFRMRNPDADQRPVTVLGVTLPGCAS